MPILTHNLLLATIETQWVMRALWLGLAALTIALLVVSWTRWGQSRPMSKCIALSVFAHLLFIGFAYVTNLFVEPGPPHRRGGPPLSIAIEAPQPTTSQEQPERAKPWQRFPATDVVAPRIGEKPRPAVTPSPTISRRSTAGTSPSAALPDDTFVEPPTGSSASPAAPSTDRRIRSTPQPTEIADTPAVPSRGSKQPPPETPTPDAGGLPRPAVDDPQSKLRPGFAEKKGGASAVGDVGDLAKIVDLPPPEVSEPRDIVEAVLGNGKLGRQRLLASGEPLPPLYRGRVSNEREKIAQQQGGSKETEAAVRAALAWLAKVQSADGRWKPAAHGAGREQEVAGHNRRRAGARADTGITGLALLAMLSAGHTHTDGEYKDNVRRGIEFLIGSQSRDGNLSGDATLYAKMYCHGMASLALSECYAMTGDARLRPHVEQAVAYSLAAQDPGSGGWRYQSGDRGGDMSQFGWQLMFLHSAELAGLKIPAENKRRMQRFLASVSTGRAKGLAAYRPQDRPTPTMTAEALFCRLLLGEDRQSAATREAADYIVASPPSDERPNLYFWYYATVSLYQVQDDNWKKWNTALRRQLIARQRTAGELAGSWDPKTRWGGHGGRVYSTALATLCLEVYYRYLPLMAVERVDSH